jgi:C-terminal processing protease CtpA/Prc
VVKAKGSQLNVFEVTEVRQQSAAYKAGVETGDIILSINGIPAQMLNLNQVNGFFNTKPKKKIRLEINRKGLHLRKDFQLEDQI